MPISSILFHVLSSTDVLSDAKTDNGNVDSTMQRVSIKEITLLKERFFFDKYILPS